MTRIKRIRLALPTLSALVVSALLVSSAVAAPASFELYICESQPLVADPNNPQLAAQAASASQIQLLSGRDMPYMQLWNTSPVSSDASITRFSLTLSSAMSNYYNFDWAKSIQMSPGMTANFIFPDNLDGSLRSNAIEVEFTGFTTDKFIRFQTDIDNDFGNINMFTDYRKVLFDLNGFSTANNALVDLDFNDPVDGDAFYSDVLPNFTASGQTAIGMQFLPCAFHDNVGAFAAGGSSIPVPEPSTWALALVGMAGLAYGFRRSRTAR